MKNNRKIMCLGMLTVALAGTSLAANYYTQTGGYTGNYTNTATWQAGALPSGGNFAYLRYGATVNLDSVAPNVDRLYVTDASALNIQSGADITVGSGYVYAGYAVGATTGNQLNMSGGTLNASERLYLGYNAAGTTAFSDGTINAGRTFIGNTAGATWATTQTGGTIVSGNTEINLSSASSDGTYALNGGVFETGYLYYRRQNAGTANPFTMGGNGTLRTTRIQFIDTTWGTANTTFVQDGGILSPTVAGTLGSSEIGRLSIYNAADTASYTMGSAATLSLQLAGTNLVEAVGGYDRLIVENVLTADGTLDVSLYGGYAPEDGDVFNILTAGTFAGSFDTVNLPALGGGLSWDQSNLMTDGNITVIPEPATLNMVALMGGAMLFIRKKFMI